LKTGGRSVLATTSDPPGPARHPSDRAFHLLGKGKS
jgi:hypothetical protein